MRRTLAVCAVAATLVGVSGSTALATPPPEDDEHAQETDGGGADDGWVPVDPAAYAEPVQAASCGGVVTITNGDVFELEERVTELATGEILTEYRGAWTLDLVRESDGATIDELDISGAAWELVSVADGEAHITNVLYGASLLWPYVDVPADLVAFEEAGLPSLAYFTDPEQSVEVEFTVDEETGEITDVEFDRIDAEVVDLCPAFDDSGHP